MAVAVVDCLQADLACYSHWAAVSRAVAVARARYFRSCGPDLALDLEWTSAEQWAAAVVAVVHYLVVRRYPDTTF